MKIFINSLDPNEIICCPFLGIEWDGTYDNLRKHITDYCLKDKKLIPFKLDCQNMSLFFSKTMTHPEANKSSMFFLFKGKQLVKDAAILSGISFSHLLQ